jgi:hypothetical protein
MGYGSGQLISFVQAMVNIGSVCVAQERASVVVLVSTISGETQVEV